MIINKKIKKTYQRIIPHIKTFIQDKILLDIGCGDGTSAFLLKKNNNIKKIILSDIEDIRQNELKKIKFYKTSIINIQNQKIDEEIDIILLKYMIHHLDPKINLNNILLNLSKIADTIVIIEEIKNSKTNLKKAIGYDREQNIILGNKNLKFFNYRTNEEFLKLFKKNNFKIIKNRKFSNGKKSNGWLEKRIYIIKKLI